MNCQVTKAVVDSMRAAMDPCLQSHKQINAWVSVRTTMELVRLVSGTRSNQTLAKGHVLFQKRLGTSAVLFKGGFQLILGSVTVGFQLRRDGQN